MQRFTSKSGIGEGVFKYKVRYESVDAPLGAPNYRSEQYNLLRMLVDNQGMMDCGPVLFQSMKMWHDGQKWLLELESTS